LHPAWHPSTNTTTTDQLQRKPAILPRSFKQPDDVSAKKKLFVLLLVERGLDMSSLLDGDHDIEGLKEHCRQRGKYHLEDFDKNHPPWPTHLVISTQAKVKSGHEENLTTKMYWKSSWITQCRLCQAPVGSSEGSKAVHRPPFREPSMMEKVSESVKK
jgi:hypothetical protein